MVGSASLLRRPHLADSYSALWSWEPPLVRSSLRYPPLSRSNKHQDGSFTSPQSGLKADQSSSTASSFVPGRIAHFIRLDGGACSFWMNKSVWIKGKTLTASRDSDCGPEQSCYQTRARYPGEPINQRYPLAGLRNHVFRREVVFVFHATKPGNAV